MVLNTILYENNYTKILTDSNWFLNYKSDIITKKLITVNNVTSRDFIEYELNNWKEKYNFDYFFVEDYEKESIEFFNLDIDKKTTLGYYYIIPYFSLITFLKNGFVFNVSQDCTETLYFDDNFLIESIKEISSNEKIPVTTLNWNLPKHSNGYDVGKWEEIETFRYKEKIENNLKHFWYSVGFVDQIFIASIDKLKHINYNLTSYDNPIYHGPWYCPNSWERRVAEFMYKNDQYRGVWKQSNHYYIHPGHSL
jgi:hypothetical protein